VKTQLKTVGKTGVPSGVCLGNSGVGQSQEMSGGFAGKSCDGKCLEVTNCDIEGTFKTLIIQGLRDGASNTLKSRTTLVSSTYIIPQEK
jgi:hypothetical protein